jgi:hypothetical protein
MLRFRRGYEVSQINGTNKQNILFKEEKHGYFLTGLYKENTNHQITKCHKTDTWQLENIKVELVVAVQCRPNQT